MTGKKKKVTIKVMLRARKLVKYLENYDEWEIVSWSRFVTHLVTKKYFCEDWRDMLKRLVHSLTGTWVRQGKEKSLRRMRGQRKTINDLINFCLDKDYIRQEKLMPRSKILTEIDLFVEPKGRRFIKLFPFPLSFIEECGREYGHAYSIVVTFIGTGVIGTLLANWDIIWSKWINLLSKPFY